MEALKIHASPWHKYQQLFGVRQDNGVRQDIWYRMITPPYPFFSLSPKIIFPLRNDTLDPYVPKKGPHGTPLQAKRTPNVSKCLFFFALMAS